jgi:hypothetical protein
MAMALTISFIIGSVYRFIPVAVDQLTNFGGAFFFCPLALMFISLISTPHILATRQLFVHESKNNVYGPLPHFISQSIAMLPFVLLKVVVCGILQYYLIGLRRDWFYHLLYFLAILYISLLWAESVINFIVSLVPNAIAAMSIGSKSS